VSARRSGHNIAKIETDEEAVFMQAGRGSGSGILDQVHLQAQAAAKSLALSAESDIINLDLEHRQLTILDNYGRTNTPLGDTHKSSRREGMTAGEN
jgi:hypothetical protein